MTGRPLARDAGVGRTGPRLESVALRGVRPLQMEVQRLRLRSAVSARWVGLLLLIAVVTMAVGRYL